MVMADNSMEDDRTLWVGNIHNKVTEELLWELFLQAGPLESIKIPKDHKTGRQKNFGFVKFQHQKSVLYVITLMDGIRIFDTPLKLCPKNKSSTNGNATDADQRQDSSKRRRMNEGEQYQSQGHLMNPNFPGQWGASPHLMAQYPMHPSSHWRQQSFQVDGGHREGSPYAEWGMREEPRPRSSRREEELAIHRSYSTPEEEYDRRRGDSYKRHERRRR